jgi:hypothetical protein
MQGLVKPPVRKIAEDRSAPLRGDILKLLHVVHSLPIVTAGQRKRERLQETRVSKQRGADVPANNVLRPRVGLSE